MACPLSYWHIQKTFSRATISRSTSELCWCSRTQQPTLPLRGPPCFLPRGQFCTQKDRGCLDSHSFNHPPSLQSLISNTECSGPRKPAVPGRGAGRSGGPVSVAPKAPHAIPGSSHGLIWFLPRCFASRRYTDKVLEFSFLFVIFSFSRITQEQVP